MLAFSPAVMEDPLATDPAASVRAAEELGAAPLSFSGSGGLPLVADAYGAPDDPAVVLLGRSRPSWRDAARALAAAGRYAIALELGEADIEALAEKLRRILGQLHTRPVVVAVGRAGLIALAALQGAEALGSGLILADAAPWLLDEAASRAGALKLPLLILHGADGSAARLRAAAPVAELAQNEGGGDDFNAAVLEFLERRIPRAPISFEAGSDPRILRDALGCFGTGVIIATTLDEAGEPVGLTVNSFTSVSLDPPLVLFCVAKTSNSLPAFEQAKAYAVNVLHIGQQPTSTRFAKTGERRFEATATEIWESGAPIISGSLASIECAPYARHEAGDHIIFIGHVRRARFEPRRDPLIFFRGGYRRLHFT